MLGTKTNCLTLEVSSGQCAQPSREVTPPCAFGASFKQDLEQTTGTEQLKVENYIVLSYILQAG